MSVAIAPSRGSLSALHARFAPVQAAVEALAGSIFRRVRNRHDREDLAAEAVLVAWQHYLVRVADAAAVVPRAIARHATAVAARLFRRDLLAC
jgi:DNA-directed RNA polymerase specialized sigma24 family protein